MKWSDQQQARLNALRTAELSGTLDQAAEAELEALIELLEAEEHGQLAPALGRMRAEQAALIRQLQEGEAANERLATLAAQQEQWLADARLLLGDLRRRHQAMRRTYQAITGEPLVAA